MATKRDTAPAPESGQRLLCAFVDTCGHDHKDIAERVGAKPSTFCDYMKGRARPKVQTRELIERVTNGAVPAASWETKEERAALAAAKPLGHAASAPRPKRRSASTASASR